MVTKELTYPNLDGEMVTEQAYFNLTRAELLKMDASLPGGFDKYSRDVMARRNGKELIQFMDMLILTAYGTKSVDGRFIKPQDQTFAFAASEAYSALLDDLMQSQEAIQTFIEGIMPKMPQDHKKEGGVTNFTPFPGKAPVAVDKPIIKVEAETETEEERINRLVNERIAAMNKPVSEPIA